VSLHQELAAKREAPKHHLVQVFYPSLATIEAAVVKQETTLARMPKFKTNSIKMIENTL